MYVNGGNRPARNEFVGVDAFYGDLYDRAGLRGGICDVSGRAAFGVLIYGFSSNHRRRRHSRRARLYRSARLAQDKFLLQKIFVRFGLRLRYEIET